jgi:hypothetical protein
MTRWLIVTGVVLIGVGLLINVGVPLGRLPGDIVHRRGNSTFYFPIVTCILASIVLTLIGWLLRR